MATDVRPDLTRWLERLAGPWLLLVVLSAAISFAAILWPWVTGIIIVLLLLTVMAARALSGLRFWQQMTLIGLMGYIVLDYGFANLTIPGVPVPVGHLLMSAGLLVALPGRGADVRAFIREPVVWCWLGLAGLTMLHLIVEIPSYGIWAIRDSNFIVEGIFLLSGFLWARERLGLPSMVRGLLTIFVIASVYGLAYPASEQLIAISPRSGVFLDVPLLGTYWSYPFVLVAGALCVFLLGREVLKWPRVVVGSLALLSLFWSLVFQARSMYVGILAVPVLLALIGERHRAAKAIAGIAMSVLLVMGVTATGMQLEGRIGTLTPEFLVQHLRSMLLVPGTPSVGTTQWRIDAGTQILNQWTASAATIGIGQGFGQALTDWEVSPELASGGVGTGVQVRAPHNTTITVVVRLGLAGLLFWVLMHARIAYLLVRAIRRASRATVAYGFAVWMLAFYVLAMLFTSAQPFLEFSQGAIPFYTLIGFAIGRAIPKSGARANTLGPAGAS